MSFGFRGSFDFRKPGRQTCTSSESNPGGHLLSILAYKYVKYLWPLTVAVDIQQISVIRL